MNAATIYALEAIVLMGLATFITRALPFAVLRGREDHPTLRFIGRSLPPAVMALLVVYCVKDARWTQSPYGLPELAAVAITGGLQWWKRQSLLSIALGTTAYIWLS